MPDFSSETRHTISKDEVRRQLPHLHPPLRLLGEDWLAASTTIDFLAVDPAGDVTLLLVGEAGEDPALLTRALAHRSWVAARLGNWRQLAPDAGIAADAQVRAVLLCPSFAAETLAAAESLEGAIQPVLCGGIESNGELHPASESLAEAQREPQPEAQRETPPGGPSTLPAARTTPRGRPPRVKTLPFRCGLTEEELDLTPEEVREFS